MREEIEVCQQRDPDRTAGRQSGESRRAFTMANCHNLKKQLEIEEEKVKSEDLSLVHENVNEEEIAKIVSRWTGIPVAKLTERRTE